MKRLGFVSLLALAWADPALAQAGPQLSTEPGAAALRGGFVTPARVVPAPLPPAVTQIDPDLAPTRTLNTNVTPVGPIYTIDGGTRTGNNLFHSFATFNLAAGDTAQWVHTTGNPLTVANVINRVTGGTPSQLFGTLDSTAIPNADFYFINPAGLVFGATAQVNVPAAAHFSTASELRFDSGPAFSVAAPDGSTLNVAAPQAFGFIGNEGGILVSGVDPNFLPNAGVLTLTAGDIAIEDSAFDTGEIVLAAVGATAAEVGIDGSLSGPLAGQLTITNSSLTSRPGGGHSGGVTVAAGDLTLAAASNVTSLDFGIENAGNVTVVAGTATLLGGSFISSDSNGTANGGQVNVIVAGLLALDGGSFLASDTFGSGNAGGVSVLAGAVELTAASFITSNAFGDGDGGIVTLDVAGRLALSGNSYISSDTSGAGMANGVIVNAGEVELSGASRISSDALGDGDGGLVGVDVVGLLTLSGGSSIRADSSGAGDGFGVIVNAGEARLSGGSFISSDARGSGNGGVVGVDVVGLLSLQNSHISSDTFGDGDGLGVLVNAGELELLAGSYISSDAVSNGNGGVVFADVVGLLTLDDGSYISSDSLGAGNGGGVFVTAGDAALSVFSYISSDALGDGFGGLVDVRVAGQLSLDFGSYISSDVGGSGDGGDVFVSANRIDLTLGSFISSDTLFGSIGNAGNVTVEADTLNLSESHISSDAFGDGDGGIVFVTAGNADLDLGSYISSDSIGQGNGGFVDVAVAGLLSLGGGSYISSDVYGDGFGGDVFVTADRLVLLGGSEIRSNVQDVFGFAFGSAGNVFVDVRSLQMGGESAISSNSFGFGDAGNVTVLASTASLGGGSFIASDALFEGNGGTVDVIVDGQLALDLGSYISADVGGSGDAGNVFVASGRISLTRGSFISSDTLFGSTGDAGNVTVDTGDLAMADDSYISSDSIGFGNAGTVFLNAGRATLASGSFISSNALLFGNAGGVFITGGNFSLDDSSITSEAAIDGNGGDIFMDLSGTLELSGSRIGTDTAGEGFAGNISISAADIRLSDLSVISSDALPGSTGTSGFIEMVAGTLLVEGASQISTISFNPNPAGAILIDANRVTVQGVGSRISSENLFDGTGCQGQACAAGLISIATLGDEAEGIFLLDGGTLTTNSLRGPAGNIELLMAPDTLLILQGRDNPGVIETSSGPGTGGVITISRPLAIVSNGGRISALGQSGGANVLIDTPFFIASADRLNVVEVSGVLEFSSAISDVSAGTVNPDLTVLDASGVLRGQCAAQRSSGELSQLTVREIGPYAPTVRPPTTTVPPEPTPTVTPGDCM